jgi:hypothetical protein
MPFPAQHPVPLAAVALQIAVDIGRPEAQRCPPQCICGGRLTPEECEYRLDILCEAINDRAIVGLASRRLPAGRLRPGDEASDARPASPTPGLRRRRPGAAN